MRNNTNKEKGIVHLVLFLMFFLVVQGYAQTNKAEIIMNQYAKSLGVHKEYQVTISYNIYKGFDSNTPHDRVSGVLYKYQENTYSNLGEAEIISTNSNYIKINHKEKAILLTKPLTNASQYDINLVELYKYLNVRLVKETGSFFRLEFTPKGITQLPFSSLVIDLDKKTYLIKRQLLKYFNKMNFSKDFQNPVYDNYMLEIVYKGYRMSNFSISRSAFDIRSYIKDIKEKKVVAPKFKGYELVKI
ncbi:hypothetical protein [Tenacibaculum sp. nBUS_03]|uniref:hypothetical protein n=1 Tax=Tenacibaculum sp. nBUS_03 TaxID=3395320 RepID=UPI003EB9DF01